MAVFLIFPALEEFDFLASHFTQQHVGETAGAKSEPLVGEPFFAQNLFDDGVIGQGICDGI